MTAAGAFSATLLAARGRPPAYLLAGSRAHAVGSAVTDWGWRQVGVNEFETPEGERVRYLAEPWRLRAVAPGARVYRGYGATLAPEIRAMFDVGRLVEAFR